jgi:transglutaminase-like putative cysteine protease
VTLDAPVLIDHAGTNWGQVDRTVYLVTQRVRYDYPAPVSDLRQRLMLVPPARHGDQRRLSWRLDSSGGGRRTLRDDRFSNLVVEFRVPSVARSIEFTSSALVERRSQAAAHRVRPLAAFHRPSSLTVPTEEIGAVGRDFGGAGDSTRDRAEAICAWTASRLTFRSGVTTTATTAGQACALGVGVCQDFAHLMIAVCRCAGLAARYVSGHLLGEGPSHAWVEVLIPAAGGEWCDVTAFDPTHNRRVGLEYVSIASGRDYEDVAPTSGTCRADAPGCLTFDKRVGIADLRFRD